MTKYSHFKNSIPCGADGMAVGANGSEVSIADASGNLSHGGTVLKAASKLNSFSFNAEIDDVSSAGSSWSAPSPSAGTIDTILLSNGGTISSGAAGITFEIGGTLVSGGGITIASGTVGGALESATPTANMTLTAGSIIECITDGGSTGTSKAKITFVCEHS